MNDSTGSQSLIAALYVGDCIERMGELGDASVDAIVTDPPYGLGFMGKEWDSPGGTGDFPMRRTDAQNMVNTGASRQGGRQRSCEDFTKRQARDARSYQEWCEAWGRECLRVLKPGGHLAAFGGTRTYHRLAAGLEDAGFELRDTLAWLYGSGFPKSRDIAKDIDKMAGHWRGRAGEVVSENSSMSGANYERTDKGEPVTAAAAAAGLGTALKPAFEPITLARKSPIGTVAANVMEHGTGALALGRCAIEFRDEADEQQAKQKNRHADFGSGARENTILNRHDKTRAEQGNYNAKGRWPANVLLDEDAAAILDEQSGHTISRSGEPRSGKAGDGWGMTATGAEYDDEGGASRFFYCAKTDKTERHAGLAVPTLLAPAAPEKNDHPTVKPLDLMRWLVRLLTPIGGVVLDPFLGSGSTAIAAALEGFAYIGIEREPDYMRIAEARLAFWTHRTVVAA